MMSIFKRINAPQPTEENKKVAPVVPPTPTPVAPTPAPAPVAAPVMAADSRVFVVKTLQGLEPVLCAELTALGATHVLPLKRAVEARGDMRMIYRANYELRTALRVLVPIHSFKAFNEKQFYEEVRNVDWSEYMDVSDTLAVDAVVSSDIFRHSKFTALLTKDAVVDQFRDRLGRRPDINTTAPTLRISVRVHNTQCDLLLDTSGDSLHYRGYRRDSVDAPLNEVLAAGMILFSGWNGTTSFADTMCGSGTLPIEAAMLGLNIPPQRFREIPLGFTRWKTFDKALWKSVQADANAKTIQDGDFQVFASDKDSRARNATAINAMAAGLERFIHIEKVPFEKAIPPDVPGTLIMNPPYDERMEVDDIAGFYKSIGDRLKQSWSGWNAWIITSNQEAMKKFGLRPSRKINLINGSLECSFQRFDLYEGSKRDQYETEKVAQQTIAPEVQESAVTVPIHAEPEVREPVAAKFTRIEPEVREPMVAKFVRIGPEIKKPVVAEEVVINDLEIVDKPVAEPILIEPKITEPVSTDLEIVAEIVAKPKVEKVKVEKVKVEKVKVEKEKVEKVKVEKVKVEKVKVEKAKVEKVKVEKVKVEKAKVEKVKVEKVKVEKVKVEKVKVE